MVWVKVDQVLDLLFPPRCLLCGQAPGPAPVCPPCEADLPWLEGGVPPEPAATPFAAVRSALIYEYPVDRLILAVKFGRQVPVARALGQLLARRLPLPDTLPDAVVPVPLHWRREAARGFNQSEEIARALCRAHGWPLRPNLARRVRPTPEQSGLNAAARQENLRGAFALVDARAAARCRHVLVVDDVLTTGATARALASAFQAAGAGVLSLWTVAWTPPPQAAARKV